MTNGNGEQGEDRRRLLGWTLDMFNNMLLLATLGDTRGQSTIAALKTRFKADPNALAAVTAYESQLSDAVNASAVKR